MVTAGLSALLALLAQAAAAPAGGAAPDTTKPAPSTVQKPADKDCSPAVPSADQRQIVICAQRPNGYRLNPDVMEARREHRSGGPPPPPNRVPRPDCTSVGPAPCMIAGINLLGAAMTAVTMAERAVKGENVGKMFVTDPTPDEYHLYLEAKRRREEREADEALDARIKAQAAPVGATEAAPSEKD